MIQFFGQFLRKGLRPARAGRLTAIFLATLMVAACADGPRGNPPAVASAPAATGSESAVPLPSDADIDYRLGSGDKLRVIVFGEPNLSGEFDVSGSGKVALPLIGQVDAAGLTVSQFETAMITKLMDGYLNSPRVSVEVMNYRPFYIYGEVGNPGQYPYTNGMTVLNAIAVAGGLYLPRQYQPDLHHPGRGRRADLPGEPGRQGVAGRCRAGAGAVFLISISTVMFG